MKCIPLLVTFPQLFQQFEPNAMKQFWDSRYGEDKSEYAYGTDPNEFLAEHVSKILPCGADSNKILCLAEGEGRNGVFLATQLPQFEIIAVDQSEVGLSKAKELAQSKGVSITTIPADLNDFVMDENSYDAVISIFAHLPPPVRKKVHSQVLKCLKPGGVLLLEGYTVKHYDMPGVGGPPPQARDMMYDLEELREELEGLELAVGEEVEREVNEGKYHKGLSATLQIVGRKKM